MMSTASRMVSHLTRDCLLNNLKALCPACTKPHTIPVTTPTTFTPIVSRQAGLEYCCPSATPSKSIKNHRYPRSFTRLASFPSINL